MKWADDITKHDESRWMNIATNREEWNRIGEAYVKDETN